MKKLLACICASERLPSWRSHLKGLGWLGMVGGPGVNIYSARAILVTAITATDTGSRLLRLSPVWLLRLSSL